MCLFGMARWIKKTIEITVKELEYKRKVSRKNLTPKYQAFCNREIRKVKGKRKKKLLRAQQKEDVKRKNRIDDTVRKAQGKTVRLKGPLVSQLKRKLLALLQEYVRYRDTDKLWWWRCITCRCPLHLSKLINWRRGNGWHCLDSKVNATAFDERNINLQCNACNMKQAKGDMQVIEEHRRAIDEKYGIGTFNELYILFKKRTLLSPDRLKEQITLWSKKVILARTKKHLT